MLKHILAGSVLALSLAVFADTKHLPGSDVPDLTKGGELTRINQRWVGPLGIYCGAWRPDNRKYKEQLEFVRQLLVMTVEPGSPADGMLEVGDVILGADGTGAETVPYFEGGVWGMIPIADAITEAEARDPALLKLLVWRPINEAAPDEEEQPAVPTLGDLDEDEGLLDDLGIGFENPPVKQTAPKIGGTTATVTIQLESLGRYSTTAPYDCEKSRRILRRGIKAIYEADSPGKAGFQLLCLLAGDDPTNPENATYQARAQEWAHQLEPGGNPWMSGAKLIALSEYYMKTKDEAIFPKLVATAEAHARGVSWFGTTGHRFSEPQPNGDYGGRIAGYGPINCSGALGFLGLSLARRAGVDSPVVQAANDRQIAFFGHFANKSGMGYGEHPYGLAGGLGDINGKSAMSGLALGLRVGQEAKAKFFCGMAATSTYSQRQYAHGGSYFGQVMHPIGAAQGGEKAANLIFKEIRWHLDLKRRWDHGRIYDSSGNGYSEFGPEATALLFYAMPLRRLYVTGRGQKESLRFSDAEFNELVADRDFDATQASNQGLIDALSSLRRRAPAAGELATRMKASPDSGEWPAVIDQLLVLASNQKAGPTGRSGACKALQLIKDRNNSQTAAMKNAEIAKTMAGLLRDPDPYVRFGGVRVLQKLPAETVRPHADQIMDAAIATGRPTFPLDAEDPVQWAHGQMGALLAEKVLKNGLDGLDRKTLLVALRSLLDTPDGGARNVVSRCLDKLTMEETLELADVIVDTVRLPAPANSMFDGAAEVSQNLLAKYQFEEALSLSAAYNPGSLSKTKLLERFGPSAFAAQSSRALMKAIGNMMLVEAIEGSDQLIGQIQNGTAPKTLNTLKRIDAVVAADQTLSLPATQTELRVEARNFAVRDARKTTYTWRKVYGAGQVAFSPSAGEKTTVTFIDKRPGKYRFAVTMADSLGYIALTETVDVTLHDAQGKLPPNTPPQAKSQSLEAVPGLPLAVSLGGSDPDGDALGFVVTQQPTRGRLSGVGGKLTYTADYGRPKSQEPAEKPQEPAPIKAPSFDDLDSFDELGIQPPKPVAVKTAPRRTWTDSFTFEAIDGQGARARGRVDFVIADEDVGVAVYEGFDYLTGTVIGQRGGGCFGFDGPWKKSDGKRGENDFWVEAGALEDLKKPVSFSSQNLPATGGKLIRGANHRHALRALDREILSAHKLLDDGQELWFSLFVQGPSGKGRLQFGLDGYGEDATFGFVINGYSLHATINGEESGTARNPWSRQARLRFAEDGPNMIIGRCIWGKDGADEDTLEIYRVFDAPEFGPLVLDEPAARATALIAQEKIKGIYLHTQVTVDEIRIGPTRHSVMLGTKPLE